MREYNVIDSANSVEQLRLRLKEGELEQYGEAFTPDFVYDVITRLPRFVTMRVSFNPSSLCLSSPNNSQRGHQQDAEEFLGFLLEGLHDECVQVMRASSSNNTSAMATPTNGPASPVSDTASLAGSHLSQGKRMAGSGPQAKSCRHSVIRGQLPQALPLARSLVAIYVLSCVFPA